MSQFYIVNMIDQKRLANLPRPDGEFEILKTDKQIFVI